MKKFKAWAIVTGWAALIVGFSCIPNLHTGLACDMALRKTAHVVEYFLLTLFLYRAMLRTRRFRVSYLPALVLGLVFAFAVTDEFHQVFVTGRYGVWRDVWIDQIGALLALAAVPALPQIARLRARVAARPSEKSSKAATLLSRIGV